MRGIVKRICREEVGKARNNHTLSDNIIDILKQIVKQDIIKNRKKESGGIIC